MNSKVTKPIFAIQLKVNESILDVDVLEGDDKDTLTERVCRDNRIGAEYKRTMQGKIIDALLKVIQEQRMNPHLKDKVQRFVQKNTEHSFDQPQIKTVQTQPVNQNLSSIIVVTPSKNGSPSKKVNSLSPIENSIDHHKISVIQVQSQIKSKSPSPNRHKNGKCSHVSIVDNLNNQSLKIHESKVETPPVTFKPKPRSTIKKQPFVKTQKINKVQYQTTGKQCQKTTDEDLVKAYKTVLSKCKDQKMKLMAQKMLESINQSFAQQQKSQIFMRSLAEKNLSRQKSTAIKRSSEKLYSSIHEPKATSYERDGHQQKLLTYQSSTYARRDEPYQRKYIGRAEKSPIDEPYERKYSRQAIRNKSIGLIQQHSAVLSASTSMGHIYRNLDRPTFERVSSTTLYQNKPQMTRGSRDRIQYTEIPRSIGSNYTKKYRYIQNLV